VWASGSQVWSGHIGTFTANPRKRAKNTQNPKVPPNCPAAPRSAKRTMSKVRSPALPERKYRLRKPSSMKAEPNKVNRKNLIAA
jgi:hypothetical protein